MLPSPRVQPLPAALALAQLMQLAALLISVVLQCRAVQAVPVDGHSSTPPARAPWGPGSPRIPHQGEAPRPACSRPAINCPGGDIPTVNP